MKYPEDFLNRIVCGDSLSLLRSIPENSIDFMLTSPPYDDLRTYKGFSLNLDLLGHQIYRILKPNGIAVLVMQDRTKNWGKSLTTFKTIINWCDLGFSLFECPIYSRKGNPGAWWTKRFRVDHEYIPIFVKGTKPRYFNKSHMMVKSKHAGKSWTGTQRLSSGKLVPRTGKVRNTKCRGTIWKYTTSNSEGNKTKSLHPATFPDNLAQDIILCFSQIGDIVLDPLVGSGTTAVLAKKNNRQFIGIDISKEYCSIARQRLANETS